MNVRAKIRGSLVAVVGLSVTIPWAASTLSADSAAESQAKESQATGSQTTKEPPIALPLPVPDATELRYALITADGELIRPPDLQQLFEWTADGEGGFLAPARGAGGKWGYLDHRGRWVVEPTLDAARTWADNGLARFARGEKWGYLNRQGQVVIEPAYGQARAFSEGLAAVLRKKGWSYIDGAGDVVIEGPFAQADDFSAAGLAPVQLKKGGKYGYIDRQGKLVIRARFAFAQPFSSGGVAAVSMEEYGDERLIDTTGKWLNSTVYSSVGEFGQVGLAYYGTPGFYKTGFLDSRGNELFQTSTHHARASSCGRIRLGSGGFYDLQGKLVIPDKYDWADHFRPPCKAVALRSGTWGILDPEGSFQALPKNYREPWTALDGWALGFQVPTRGLAPFLTEDGRVEFVDGSGAPRFLLERNPKTERVRLTTADGREVWMSGGKVGNGIFRARIIERYPEHFTDPQMWTGDISAVAQKLVAAKPRDFYPIGGFYSEREDAYDPGEDDPEEFEEYKSRGALEVLAESFVGEEHWGAYEFLDHERSQAFRSYFETLAGRLDEAFEPAGEEAPVRYLHLGDGNDQRVWKVGGRYLVLEKFVIYGDGEFWNYLWLAVIDPHEDA